MTMVTCGEYLGKVGERLDERFVKELAIGLKREHQRRVAGAERRGEARGVSNVREQEQTRTPM